MKILVLGGTSDARKITHSLIEHKLNVVYSVAGLVRKPDVACDIISGGFTIHGGLKAYLEANEFDMVIDATHPYALKMSETAITVCDVLKIPYLRFDRPEWQTKPGDNWTCVRSWDELLISCQQYERPFVTTGQLSQYQLDEITRHSARVIYRTAAPAQAHLSDNVEWLKAIGPFDTTSELALMKRYQIDVLVSKNAGGAATYGKLAAARALNLPVIMLQRAAVKKSKKDNMSSFQDISKLVEYIKNC